MMPAWNPQAAAPPPPPPVYSYPQPGYTPVTVRSTFSAPYPNSTSSMPSALYPAHAGYTMTYPPAPAPANQTTSEIHTAPAPTPAKSKTHFPDSVRVYVQRAFIPANLDPTVTRAEMEEKLKETISHASNSGVMYTIGWENMPLPQQMIREERARALAFRAANVSDGSRPAPAQTTQKSKKRKSDDFDDGDDSSAAPPWRKGAPLDERVTRQSPERRQPADDTPHKSKSQKQMEKRQRRLDGGYKSTYRAHSPTPEPEKPGPVVGTCQVLEKKYLRLTAMPNPANVRPEHVLQQTLDLLKKKWRKEANYSYICDQFKSMRQDLTVQRIKNDFTVHVYEIHARIALEKGDLGEYNQCQTQLKAFYRSGLKGSRVEFTAYRILYFIHTANRAALNDAIKDLTAADKEAREVKHALGVRSSLALGNYHRFFQLYMDTPNMGAYLMDMFVGRERLAALSNICKAFKPDVRLRFITEELGFESDADTAQFIIDHGGQPLLEERDDYIAFLSGKAGALFEDARKVAFSKVDIKGQI